MPPITNHYSPRHYNSKRFPRKQAELVQKGSLHGFIFKRIVFYLDTVKLDWVTANGWSSKGRLISSTVCNPLTDSVRNAHMLWLQCIKLSLTLGHRLLHGHLVASNGVEPSDVAATTARSSATPTSARPWPGAHHFPPWIKKLLHFFPSCDAVNLKSVM